MKQFLGLLCFMPLMVDAQTIALKSVDIIYGNQLIRSQHQIVLNSPEEVSVIPVEQKQVNKALGPNVVITADGSELSYLEENKISEREQAIYDEVNKRTEEAPFTVLFTGNIPAEIQERRLRMMPEIGGVNGTASGADENSLDVGSFSPVGKSGGTPISKKPTAEEEEKLDALIGG